jgi:hypothetical protein
MLVEWLAITNAAAVIVTRLSVLQAFAGFTNRLMTVVFDNAFVVQGNRCASGVLSGMFGQLLAMLRSDTPCASPATYSSTICLQARRAARAAFCSSTALLSRSAQGTATRVLI